MNRVEFITSVGSSMFVDESRVEEYKAAGYKLAANILDKSSGIIIEEPTTKRNRKKKED